MKSYRFFTDAEMGVFENAFLKLFADTFQMNIDNTIAWWVTDEAREFFQQRQGRLTDFFRESGISNEWSSFAEERAKMGADITEQIYNYAREVQNESAIIEYTQIERDALNHLCDYTYELVKDVTEEQIQGIRDCLIQEYAEGRNSRESVLLEKLEQVQLEPIHTFSAEQRARMIARTESKRATNAARLQSMKQDGVKYVTYYCNSDCEVCNEHTGEENKIPVDEAIDGDEIFHPNCNCTPIPVADENGLRYTENLEPSDTSEEITWSS